MSKINNIRFINLNYNNNTMKIDDETLYLGGKNNLINLRNGGGKSVLVQMVMAPFVNKRKRNLKDRDFEGYFTTAAPTYILVEWLLDNNAGYLLTGMMVRKRQYQSEEDSKDKLEIINFIHEYREKNKYDIAEIPLIENKGGSRALLSFTKAKSLFEIIKKDNNYRFNYYDMNSQGKRYFDKLREYKIDNKEWEDIIHKVNLKESGLSELFSSAKNENGLVKEWFIPAIESKLNRDEDRVKKYNEIITSYIRQYKENKSKIDSKKKIELFMEVSDEIKEKAEEYNDSINRKSNIENEIANYIEAIGLVVDNVKEESKVKEDSLISIEKSIAYLEYEEISKRIYSNKDNRELEEGNLLELENKDKEIEEDIATLTRSRNILDCANQYTYYKEASEDVQLAENELQAIKKSIEEKAPRIQNLGYTINNILIAELNAYEEELKSHEEQRNNLLKDETVNNTKLDELTSEINKLTGEIGAIKEKLQGYGEEEKYFNAKYNETLSRNIEGYYSEEGIVNLNKSIEENINSNTKVLKANTEALKESTELAKVYEKDKELVIVEEANIKNKLEQLNVELQQLESKIKARKDLIKYIDFTEEKVFNNEEIIEGFNRIISGIKIKENKSLIKLNKVKGELNKLKSGNLLELPAEIEGALSKRGISILYGMQWLKNNGLSESDNKLLVKNNEFIPYSLIMDNKDIDILKEEALDVYTSFPIPIIRREDIEEKIQNSNSIVNLGKVIFYTAFNEMLLDEKELQYLIESKESDIKTLQGELLQLQEEFDFFNTKKGMVENIQLSKEYYETLQKNIEKAVEEKESISLRQKDIGNNLRNLKDKMDLLFKESEKIKENLRIGESKLEAFNLLINKYDIYKRNISLRNSLQLGINEATKGRKEIILNIENLRKEIEIKREIITNINIEIDDIKRERIIYDNYKDGEIIEKDKEDLVSEFKALSKTLTESEKDIKNRHERALVKYKREEENLIAKANDYNITEEEYTSEIYTPSKVREIDGTLKEKKKESKLIIKEKTKINRLVAILQNEIDKDYKILQSKFNESEPLQRDLVFNKDFPKEKAALVGEKQIVIDAIKELESKYNLLYSNKVTLSEYYDLKIREKINLVIDVDTIANNIGIVKRNLKNTISNINTLQNQVIGVINKVANLEELVDEEIFKDSLQTMKKLSNNPEELISHLNMVKESQRMLLQKLSTDIQLIEEEEDNIIVSLLEYLQEIQGDISKIDENSAITIDNKRRKMLNITTEDFEENKELYKIKLRDYIELIRDTGITILEENKNIEDYLSKMITTVRLYDEVINIDSIRIQLFKIEANKQYKISWKEVAKNSGGEGFLSAFVILASLLSYIRKNERDIFTKEEGGKVLIMDNPFAQTNAVHLLKPLMDVAKKSNTQLICLSGLGGDSIYNRFENIHVLNLIKSSLNSSKSYLKGEQIIGEEEKDVIVASRFDIEDSEQIRLF